MSNMTMRPSRVLAKMRAGGVASCLKVNLTDPRVTDIASQCGFDCAWLDMEHVPSSIHDIENQVRAGKMHDMDTMVRVRRGSYSDLILPLEMDAAGIMVPHIMSLDDAKEVAWRTKFHPVGRRPIDGGNADGAYCMLPCDEYIRQANEQRFITVQIEDPEPLDDLDEIAKVDGIDMLFFGPGDFSQGIGTPGDMTNPKIDETRRRVAEVARKNGKFAGTAGSLANLESYVEMGYSFVGVCADVVTLWQRFQEVVAEFNKKVGR